MGSELADALVQEWTGTTQEERKTQLKELSAGIRTHLLRVFIWSTIGQVLTCFAQAIQERSWLGFAAMLATISVTLTLMISEACNSYWSWKNLRLFRLVFTRIEEDRQERLVGCNDQSDEPVMVTF